MRVFAAFIVFGTIMAGAGPSAAEAPETFIVTESGAPQAKADLVGNAARLDETEITRVRADHIQELVNRAPGVFLHRGSGQEHLTAIRSPVLTGGAGAGSFLFLEDGVALRAPGFANVNGLFEAHGEQAGAVEIVNGPGGARYGANAVHGIINIIPEGPGDKETGLEVSAGSYGRFQSNTYVRNEAYFAGLTLLNDNGYRAASGVDQQKFTIVATDEAGPWRLTARLSGHNLNQETAGFVRGVDAYRDPALKRTNPNPEAFRDTQALRFAVKGERDLGAGKRLSVTPYTRWNDMEFLLHFLPSQALEENGHWSVGAQTGLYVDGKEKDSTTLFGFDWDYTEGFLKETQSLPSFGTFPTGVHYDYDVAALTLAPYIHSEKRLGDRWKATLGVRADYTHYDYTTNEAPGFEGRFQRPPDRTDDFFSVLGKAGLLYQATDTTRVYVTAARGARPPQTTDLYRLQINQSVDDVDPETIDSLEAGFRFSGARVQADIAAFYMEKRNFLFRDADGFNVTDGETRHEGLEAALRAEISPTFAISASGTLARHTYQFSNEVSRNLTETITKGADIDTAPRRLANVRALWTPTPSFFAEAEWVHVGRYYTDAANENRYPGHDLIHLRATAKFKGDTEVFASVRNVLGRDYAERADFAFGGERYFPGEARAVSVGVRTKF